MKYIFSLFAAVLTLSPGCVAKKPILDGNYDLVASIVTDSRGPKTIPVGGQLQLSNNDYNFTMISMGETFNVKGKFSVNDSKFQIESYVVGEDEDVPEKVLLSDMDRHRITFVFTRKDGVLYLELILREEGTPNSWKLVFKKK